MHSKGTWESAARKGIPFGGCSLGTGIFLGIFVKEGSNFRNCCKTQNFVDFALENAKTLQFQSRKLGPANGTILKLWAADCYGDLAEKLPPPLFLFFGSRIETRFWYVPFSFCLRLKILVLMEPSDIFPSVKI